jgi:serine/threonine protein kinase
VLTPGAIFDRRYEIVELRGRGGMGAVYRARRTVLGDEVAIKVLATPQDDALRERFLRESRASAQLRHPHIVSILDYDVDAQGHPYLVMEYLNGLSLQQRLAVDRRLDVGEVLTLAGPLCAALQFAHQAGIVHRDIKPANVVEHEYAPGARTCKVVDFGLAHLHEPAGATRLTGTHDVLGTLAYASPEQLRGEPVDARSDIYSLAVTLYELLTGHPPFDHPDALVVLTRHLTMAPRALREAVADVPPHVEGAILRALAKDPDQRFASMNAFAAAMAGSGTDVPVPIRRGTPLVTPELRTYEIVRPLASGRLGSQVYVARHRAMGTPVALRVLTRETVPDWDAARERFLREARAMQVTHPSVLQVRDYGEEAGFLYVVTDLVEGDSLADRLTAEGPLPEELLARFSSQLVDAVAALHRRGVFLWGLSPATTRLRHDEDGDRLLVSSGGISQIQDLLGTLSEAALRGDEIRQSELPYIAPEILMGDVPSVSSDLFTVGALVYCMATGSAPYDEPSLPELLGAMLRRRATPLGEIRRDLPTAFSETIMRTLSPVPAERPEDARVLAFMM